MKPARKPAPPPPPPDFIVIGSVDRVVDPAAAAAFKEALLRILRPRE